MTREEIVRNKSWILKVIRDRCELTQAETDYLNCLIEVLEQEPCEDCISRAETIAFLKKVTVTDGITFETGFKQIIQDIEQMPSVQPKAGHWVGIDEEPHEDYECDNCGFIHTFTDGHTAQYNYCPNCGAKMESEG